MLCRIFIFIYLNCAQDEEDDWSRWKDVIFRAKAALVPEEVRKNVRGIPLEGKFKNMRKRGVKKGMVVRVDDDNVSGVDGNGMPVVASGSGSGSGSGTSVLNDHDKDADNEAGTDSVGVMTVPTASAGGVGEVTVMETSLEATLLSATETEGSTLPSASAEEGILSPTQSPHPSPISTALKPAEAEITFPVSARNIENTSQSITKEPPSPSPSPSPPHSSTQPQPQSNKSNTTPTYCPECYLPLFPDPPPEKLFIYLHALRYTTSLGSFETEMPVWAREDYVVPDESRAGAGEGAISSS